MSLLQRIKRYIRLVLRPHPKRRPPIIEHRCRTRRFGSDYGGWTICPEGLHAASVIYSVGIGEDATFDIELIQTLGVHVYAFDPTPRSTDWVKQQTLPESFHFFPIGLADKDGHVQFFPPDNPDHVSHTILDRAGTASRAITVEMKSLASIMQLLGHDTVDLLKIDIEGAEYAVIEQLTRSNTIPIKQLVVEFHDHFPGIQRHQTEQAIGQLRGVGFRVFAVSPNGNEISFIRP